MTKTVFVETEQFKQMMSYKRYVESKADKRKVKYSLLDRIKEGLGDKWHRLKEGTRQVYDQICFFSAELGFFYASDKYLAEHNNVGLRTIQYRLNELVKLGEVVKVNRRAKRTNGKGKAIYLFVNHPYFSYWAELLGINNCVTDCATEKVANPTESKEEESKKVSTYSLPKKQESNIHKVVTYVANRINDTVKKGNIIEYLSSYVDRVVRSLERQALYDENLRIEKAKKQQREQLAIESGIIKKRPSLDEVYYNYYE